MLESGKNIRLGLFVFLGTIFIIAAMYFIGENQSLFGSTIKISVHFYNVNGLMPGNNVRFGGINIGTVDEITIINDSSVEVNMVIKDKSKAFIKTNAIANIGTDGLMGNKLVNINAVNTPAPLIDDGTILQSLKSVETDEMFRTLNRTNEDIAIIAKNLKTISQRMNSQNTFWSILMDTVLSENIKTSIENIKLVSKNTITISNDISQLVQQTKNKNTSIGALLYDTNLSYQLNQSMANIKNVSDSLQAISNHLLYLSSRIKDGKGAVGTILSDSNFTLSMTQSLENIRIGSEGFNENMEALKQSLFFRRYFKKQEKLKAKMKPKTDTANSTKFSKISQ